MAALNLLCPLLFGVGAASPVHTASLRQQLQDSTKKLVGASVYNKDGCVTQR